MNKVGKAAVFLGPFLAILIATIFAAPAAADPSLPLPRLPICGDQDGSETPFILRWEDFVPATDVQAYVVPGEGPQSLRLDFIFREAAFNNELGVFTVDTASGEIDGMKPGDPGYLAAAYERASLIFPSGSTASTPDVFMEVDSGEILVFFIVQNSTLENLLANNPANEFGKSPLAFFSLDSLNPDGVDHFVGFQSQSLDLTQFGFEDLTGGGDLDYDDIVYNIEPALEPVLGCVEDEFEPDDTVSESQNTLLINQSQDHTLCPAGDEDWLLIDASGEAIPKGNLLVETFDLQPDSVNPNADTEIGVFTSLGDQIASNTDRGFGPVPGSNDIVQASRTVWHPASAQDFRVQVLPHEAVDASLDTSYSVRLLDWRTPVLPVDQASWGPTNAAVPVIIRSRSGDELYVMQYFSFDQSELDALIDLNATLAWEFRRPEPNVETGTGEEEGSNVDYLDYWQTVDDECVGWYRTNLPLGTDHADRYSEETNAISGCAIDQTGALNDEEFELYIDDPGEMVAGELYWILTKLHIQSEDFDSEYRFYITKVEYCELFLGWDHLCNVASRLGKGVANLTEGYLQLTP